MRLHVRNIDGRENIGAVFELQWGNIFDTIYPARQAVQHSAVTFFFLHVSPSVLLMQDWLSGTSSTMPIGRHTNSTTTGSCQRQAVSIYEYAAFSAPAHDGQSEAGTDEGMK